MESPLPKSRQLHYSLYAKGRVLGFKRAKRNQRPDISLVQIEGVKTAADTEFYLGKRIAFVYRAKREVNGSKIRCLTNDSQLCPATRATNCPATM